jgi:hypothetical protein
MKWALLLTPFYGQGNSEVVSNLDHVLIPKRKSRNWTQEASRELG